MSDDYQNERNKAENSHNPRYTRRGVLQGTGATIGTIGIAGLTSADNGRSSTDVYEQARRIRQRTGSQERFIQYLENHGFQVTQTTNEFSFPDTSGDVGTQNIVGRHITGTLTLSNNYGNPPNSDVYAEYHVDIDANQVAHSGAPPADHLTISWPSSDYDLVSNGTYSDNLGHGGLVSSTFNGADWEWEDIYGCPYGCDKWFALGCYLEETNPSSPPRKVQATYQSAWGDQNTSLSVSFGLDGSVSVSFSGSTSATHRQIDRQVVRE